MSEQALTDHLRERAARLRRLAVDIEHLPVLRLDSEAGDATWRGPRPTVCLATLASDQRRLHAAADDLRWQAYQLESHADDLDALAMRRLSAVAR